MLDKQGVLIMGCFIFMVMILTCLAFYSGIKPALVAERISCEDQHQLIITKVPYVEGDRIIIYCNNTNTVTEGGLTQNGQFIDIVCSNAEYTVTLKSVNGQWIESTFYPIEDEYIFSTDESGKPDIVKEHIPVGETRYRYNYNNITCYQFGGDGECTNLNGHCCDGICGITITKNCEGVIHGNEME